jgi:glycosyltransferase involved in cell wall biosynthesis
MRILVVGCGKSNFNYRKIEGFYNSFSKIGETEWVEKMFDCKYEEYDIVFGEVIISEIYENLERYLNMTIKDQFIWMSYSYNKMIELSNLKKDTNFIIGYKTNVLDKGIVKSFIEKHGKSYQVYKEEGFDMNEYFNFNPILPSNLDFCYLPCCLSEKEDFMSEKKYDICYFGSIQNRPGVKNVLDALSSKYKILENKYDTQGIKNPDECYQMYKQSKVTLSEQVHPVILEYPVRLGESTSTGCRLFLIENIDIYDKQNKFIPEYTSCSSYEDAIKKITDYLENFDIKKSKDLYENFTATYDNAVEFIIKKIKNKKI